MSQNLHPRAYELFEQYSSYSEQEKLTNPKVAAIMAELMEYLPQEFKDQLHNMAVEMGVAPEKPSGYLEDGTPVYDMLEVSKNLGISEQEAIEHLNKLNEATDGKYQIDSSKVHRVQ